MPAAGIFLLSQPVSNIQLPKLKATSRRGTQTDMTAASVTGDQPTRPSNEIVNETPICETVRDDDD